jgi:hypothetical protein|tara:strand:- start:1063 stop:2070 length:1008 start_codon:yes stop_codon:yes gene_type:complete
MAVIANTFNTYEAKGIREDLSDLISDISPTTTPFQSNIGSRDADNTFFEWQTDSLATASATPVVEGQDLSAFTAITPTVRLGNYCQINMAEFIISGTEQKVNKAGRASEVGYQAAKAAKELKRNVEVAALLNGVGAVTGATATARVTAGFPCWLKTNETSTNVTKPSYTGSTPTGASQVWKTFGTPTAFTETMLKTTMQECYESGGEPSMLMVGPYNKTVVSGFSGIASSRYNVTGAEPSVIIGAADIYVSDFGNLSVVPNRFFTSVIDAGAGSLMNNWAFLIDPDEVKIASLRPYSIESLARTGDADKRMALIEWGLQVNNEAAHGVIAGITSA